ncbi:procyclic acidic repetitive family protein [Thermosynechococcaceae cyanobacterium Okahandja]
MKAVQFWQKWFRRAPKTSEMAIPGSVLLRWQHLRQHLLQYEGWPWLVPFLMAAATVVTASSWILFLPPLPDCRHLSLIASDGDRLYCADQAARNGNLPSLAKAIETVSQWPTDHPLFPQAKRRVDEWSLALLVIARQQLSQGNIELATLLLGKIPKTAVAYDQAQELLTATNVGEGGNLLATAEAALRQQDWGLALLQVKLMNQLGTDYWREQAQKLSIRISQEQDAWGTLVLARDLAGWLTANELAEAVMLARSIPRDAVVYAQAQADIRRWIPEVFEYAEERLAYGDAMGALALIEKIAPALDVSYHDRPIVMLGQAKALAAQGTVLGYWEAIARVGQIPANDPFYGVAQEYLSRWQQQLQNASQLQLAAWLANSHWRWGYALAIQQAQQVALGQPERPQAQALIAQWQRDLRTIDEQPILNAAIALAEQENYAAAIQIVERLPANAALFAVAQNHRENWQIKLQELVDRPILDKAITLAREGKLEEAIKTAAQIHWDRHLYREAQNKIWQWEYELSVRARREYNQPATDSWWEAPVPVEPETPAAPRSTPLPTPTPEADAAPELASPTPAQTSSPEPAPEITPESSATPAPAPEPSASAPSPEP